MLARVTLFMALVAAAYWVTSAQTPEAVATLLATAATLLAAVAGMRFSPAAQVPETSHVDSIVLSRAGRPRWLIPEKYFGVAFAMGGFTAVILLIPLTWTAWVVWEWFLSDDHWVAGILAGVATIAAVTDIAFLFWLAATLVYEVADPD